MILQLLNAVAAVNGAPSGATAGKPLWREGDKQVLGEGFLRNEPRTSLWAYVKSTAGSGVITVTPALWLYDERLADWGRYVVLNGGTAIPETGADSIKYLQLLDMPWPALRRFSRAYMELTALAGTTPAFSAWLLG